MWITLTPEDVYRKVAGPEWEALRSAALAAGQTDPLPDIIADVTQTLRGYVAGCRANRLGPADTIPAQLTGAALALIRNAAIARLPISALATEERRAEYQDAIALLRDVAACRFAVEQPDVIGDETIAGPSPSITPRRLQFQRNDADGL